MTARAADSEGGEGSESSGGSCQLSVSEEQASSLKNRAPHQKSPTTIHQSPLKAEPSLVTGTVIEVFSDYI